MLVGRCGKPLSHVGIGSRNPESHLLPLLTKLFIFLSLKSKEYLRILESNPLSDICFSKIVFSPTYGFSFHVLNNAIQRAEALTFNHFQVMFFSYMFHALGVKSK